MYIPICTCGSRRCGLVFIPEESRYQCGDCIYKAYARISKQRDLLKQAAEIIEGLRGDMQVYEEAITGGKAETLWMDSARTLVETINEHLKGNS